MSYKVESSEDEKYKRDYYKSCNFKIMFALGILSLTCAFIFFGIVITKHLGTTVF